MGFKIEILNHLILVSVFQFPFSFQFHFDLDCVDVAGNTAMHVAARENKIQVCKNTCFVNVHTKDNL